MNKKFSTLMASLLLAGGLFSTASAEKLSEAVAGQYYNIYVNSGASASTSNSVLDSEGAAIVNTSASYKLTWWTVEKVELANGAVGYQLVNVATGKTFEIKSGNVTYNTFAGEEDGKLTFLNTEMGYAKGSVVESSGAWYYTAEKVAAKYATTSELNKYLEDGFTMQIGQLNDKKEWSAYSKLEGNVFTGKLTAVGEDNAQVYKLKTADGKYIQLTDKRWGDLSTDLVDGEKKGYKFATTDKEADATEFKITVPTTTAAYPVEVIATKGGENYELLVAGVNGTYYVTTGASSNDNKADYVDATGNTYVKLGDDNFADYTYFNNAVWNISKTTDSEVRVAGPAANDSWVPAEQVALEYPEGQWIWNGSKFVNRESGKTVTINELRKTDAENVFTLQGSTYTFTKVGVPGSYKEGYLDASDNNADELLKNAFYVSTPVKALGQNVYLAKDKDGVIYLTESESDAVEFRLATDKQTVHTTSFINAKGELVANGDTLWLDTYKLSDAATKEVLAYNNVTKKFYLTSEDAAYTAVAFKNKSAELYNIINSLTTSTVNKTLNFTALKNKLYGAHNTAELRESVSAYQVVDNDLFTLTKVGAAQHVSGIENDTIKIFRNADSNYVLYEQGSLLTDATGQAIEGFLGIENFLDPKFADKKPALFVESADGKDTWRPEYLLSVGTQVVEADTIWCDASTHEHATEKEALACPHTKVVEACVNGRYLVNLVDSAKACTDKDNKFMYQNYGSNPYYRLGFVQAKHVDNELVIASTNDRINLEGNDFTSTSVAEFAFHYVDGEHDAFVIETSYDGNSQGWIKYHNGIPVVTNQESEAEVFNLEVLTGEENAPTSNETIAAGSVVVAGVNGAVVVKGAEGKNVIVSTILGKVVANEVVSSDNATIAAPQGVVVVSVDGESFKVVVK